MTLTLTPDPSSLGLASPALGTWFSTSASTSSTITLAVPSADLSVPVVFGAATDWLPPATGLLSFFVGTSAPPPAIAMFRNAQGAFPFAAGRFAAVFRLLPEVEERLDALMRFIPAATASPVPSPPASPSITGPTRPRVRWLALDFPPSFLTSGSNPVAPIWSLLPTSSPPPASITAAAAGDDSLSVARRQATYLGLKLIAAAGSGGGASGATLGNDSRPMSDLRRAGTYSIAGTSGQDVLLHQVPAGTYNLWAFDSRGLAIDPGAVASWWSYLAAQVFGNLWAPFGGTAPTATCAVSPQLTSHLVNPHEGPLDPTSPFLTDRLTLSNASGTGVVRSVSSTSSALGFSFTTVTADSSPAADPTVDSAPIPRVGLLPSGTYGRTLNLWPRGPVATQLGRDFVRVAVVDVERHLVGVARSHADATSAQNMREHDQNRLSTRVTVAASTGTGPVLLPTADAAAQALLGVFDAPGPRRMVTSFLTRDWGSLPQSSDGSGQSATALPSVLPSAIPSDIGLAPDAGTPTAPYYVVHPLAGAHVDVGGAQTKRRVLFEVHLPAALNGAWVRVWPEGFDDRNGVHVRTDGGGGLALTSLSSFSSVAGSTDAVAFVVATLADGPPSSPAPPAVNILLVAADASASSTAPRLISRIYSDKRFDRPAPPSPDTPAPAPTAGTQWVICETGVNGTGPLAGRVFGGATVVVRSTGGAWSLLDRSTLAKADLAPPSGGGAGTPLTIGAKIGSSDILELTQTAFQATPDHLFPTGDPAPSSSPVTDATDGLGAMAVVDRCVRATVRTPLGIVAASTPFATMDRLEVAAASFGATGTAAALAGAPTLGPYHELLPHDVGHPGAPGAVEIHGTGVRLDGPAAIPLLEAIRDRTAGLGSGTGLSWVATLDPTVKSLILRSTPLLAIEALTSLPSPTAPSLDTALTWAAVLRTVAAGVEGEPGGASGLVATGLYPFSATQTNVTNWLTSNVGSWLSSLSSAASGVSSQLQNALSTIGTSAAAIERALDRRIKAGKFGLREAAWSLFAALGRAESFVYIETPAFDHQPCGQMTTPGTSDPLVFADSIGIWDTLLSRMSARPGLRVIFCAPVHLLPGTPFRLEDVRNSMMLKAVDDLRRQVGDDRFAFFSPSAGSGRTVRLATTTVVVDDAWVLTGTTHLSRRGLSFDSSIAATVFDDTIEMGRPKQVRDFRSSLMAGRLGVPVGLLPDDPVELVDCVAQLASTGSVRLAADKIAPPPIPVPPPPPPPPPPAYPTATDELAWNPNGGDTTVSFTSIIAALEAATAETGVDAEVSPAS